MKKHPREDRCDYATPGSRYIRGALDGLAHFHVAHSDNRYADVFMKTVTASEEKLDMGPPAERDVYIVLMSDPAVVAALMKALAPYLPVAVKTPPPPPLPPESVN
jgi:hypothetical protein